MCHKEDKIKSEKYSIQNKSLKSEQITNGTNRKQTAR